MTPDDAAPAGNLPAEPNSFVGRERDLAELVAMLGRVRSLTLCGPGGIGKTRLALRLAAALAPGYPGGAWIAELADAELARPSPARDGRADERVVQLVTAALGIRPEPDRPLTGTLIEALRPRALLLVLDTCEHVVQSCADLVQRLLADCPGVRVIATSREPLRVRGEAIWRVPPLGLPPEPADRDDPDPAGVAGSEAGRLFAERAAAVRPGFTLDAASAPAVAEICRTLDGLPLAIELAAARARALPADQIAARLADRFELLRSGNRTAPPRQQTLRAAVEWSYDLLTDAERTLLRRLCVFHGWSLRMAEQVCSDELIPAADVLDLLTALIDKSLVTFDGELNGQARYRLLDTVRDLAAEHAVASGDLPGMRARHRDCSLALAEQIAARAFVRGEPSWPERVAMYHRVRADRANLQLALGYCVAAGDADEGLRLCHALAGSWLASGEAADGAGWIDRLLGLGRPVSPGVHARALAIRAELAFELQDFPGARDYAAACVSLSRRCEDGNEPAGLRLQALTALMAGQPGDALAQADAAVAAAAAAADDWEHGVALATRATVLAGLRRLGEAEAAYEQALDVLRDNNGWGVANVLYGLGRVAAGSGEADRAVRYFADALGLYRQIDARPEMARCLAGIGWVALGRGDIAVARARLSESMQLSLATGHRLAIARGLQALAAVAAATGELGPALLLEGAALTVFDAIGMPPSAAGRRRLGELLDAARARLGDGPAQALLGCGRDMSPHHAVQQASGAPSAGTTNPGTTNPGTTNPGTTNPGTTDPEPPITRAAADGRAAGIRSPADGPADAAGAGRAASLTRREREIAALVARGLSNRAIAEQLFISQATAARHVANIFGKLGLSSRAQLVGWLSAQPDPDPDAG